MITQYGKTKIIICKDYNDLGVQSAERISNKILELLLANNHINILISAAQSMFSFWSEISKYKNIDWSRITCFSIDELWDVNLDKKNTCGYAAKSKLYDIVCPYKCHFIQYNSREPKKEVERYEKLIRESHIDIGILGIGISGHLALNEPDETNFNDTNCVKFVRLSKKTKLQLINDPSFSDQGYVPDYGITLTIPTIEKIQNTYTLTPLAQKKEILTKLARTNKISTKVPASILIKMNSLLFVDKDSCPNQWK